MLVLVQVLRDASAQEGGGGAGASATAAGARPALSREGWTEEQVQVDQALTVSISTRILG